LAASGSVWVGGRPRSHCGDEGRLYHETSTGWQVNTTGFVQFQGRFYLVTIMTESDPVETYGSTP